jgi:hypothetical protein
MKGTQTLGAKPDYGSWSIIRLLETLWTEYGKQVHFDGKGRLQVVARTYPSVPMEMMRAIQDRHCQVRALMILEGREKPIGSLVSGGEEG